MSNLKSILIMLVLLMGLSGFTNAQTTLPAPVFSPEPGTYAEPTTVTITCEGANEIYYTTDGSEPSQNNGTYCDPGGTCTMYQGTTTLKAVGYHLVSTDTGSSYVASDVTEGTYIIPEEYDRLPAMMINIDLPTPGNYSDMFVAGFSLDVVDVFGDNVIVAYGSDGNYYYSVFYKPGHNIKKGQLIRWGWIGKVYNDGGVYKLVPVGDDPVVLDSPANVTPESFTDLSQANVLHLKCGTVVESKMMTIAETTPATGSFKATQGGKEYTLENAFGLAPVEAGTYNVLLYLANDYTNDSNGELRYYVIAFNEIPKVQAPENLYIFGTIFGTNFDLNSPCGLLKMEKVGDDTFTYSGYCDNNNSYGNVFYFTTKCSSLDDVNANRLCVESGQTVQLELNKPLKLKNSEGYIKIKDEGIYTITVTYGYEIEVSLTTFDTVTLWKEDFSSYKADDKPSGGIYSYQSENGKSTAKVCAEATTGGVTPELMLGQRGALFRADIPLEGTEGDMFLTYKTDLEPEDLQVVLLNGKLISTTQIAENTYQAKINVKPGTWSLQVTFQNISLKDARLDDIELTANFPTTLAAPTVYFPYETGKPCYGEATVYFKKPRYASYLGYVVKCGDDVTYISDTYSQEPVTLTIKAPGRFSMSMRSIRGSVNVSSSLSFTIDDCKVGSVANFHNKGIISPTTTLTFTCPLTVVSANGGNEVLVYDHTNEPYSEMLVKTKQPFSAPNGWVIPAGAQGTCEIVKKIDSDTGWPVLVAESLPTAEEGTEARNPEVISFDEVTKLINRYVKVCGVGIDNGQLAVGDLRLEFAKKDANFEIDSNKIYDVTGVIVYENGKSILKMAEFTENTELNVSPTISYSGTLDNHGEQYVNEMTVGIRKPSKATRVDWVVKRNDATYNSGTISGEASEVSIPVTERGNFTIEATANYEGGTSVQTTSTKVVAPESPTLKLEAGRYYETKQVEIEAAQGTTLRVYVNEKLTEINSNTYTLELPLIKDKTQELVVNVQASESGVNSEAEEKLYVIDANTIYNEETGEREHYYVVETGDELVNMERGKAYKLKVDLEGTAATNGVLYARSTEPTARPSYTDKGYFAIYEDVFYNNNGIYTTKFDQRDWVAIEGNEDMVGKRFTGFLADFDGTTLHPRKAITSETPAADFTLNDFRVQNVYYGNFEYSWTLDLPYDYSPFFVKAKENEVANYQGEVRRNGDRYELWGSMFCINWENEGLEIDPNDHTITESVDGNFMNIKGVLVCDPYTNGRKKIVALSDATVIGSEANNITLASNKGTADYWGTYSNQATAVRLSAVDGSSLKVYDAKVNDGVLTLTKRSNCDVAKNEGVLVWSNGPTVHATPVNEALTPSANTDLVATPNCLRIIDAEEDHKLYRLTYDNVAAKSDLGFYLGVVYTACNTDINSKDGSQVTASPFKAYLDITTQAATKPATAAPARGFAFPGDDDITGIGEIVINEYDFAGGNANTDGKLYNLNGQQVATPSKGIYVKRNKKIVIK